MLQTLAQVSQRQPLEYDLCIIGAGAAGITIAHKLEASGLRVCLLEGGGLDPGSESQSLYQGVQQGYIDLLACRLRFFGGTTNHWTGYCRAPDEQDLQAKPWEPSGGWPISIAELKRHLPEAMDIVGISNQFDLRYWATHKAAVPLALPPAAFRESVSLVGPSVRFREKYRNAIERSRSVTCLVEANAVELLPSARGTRIEQVTLKTLDGKAVPLKAKAFVLACGGIENARVLLNSNSRIPAGIGNAHDLVGRFFSDHCVRRAGTAVLTRQAGAALIYELGHFQETGIGVHPHVQTDLSLAAKLQVPRVLIRLMPAAPSRATRMMESIAGFWAGEVSRTFRIEAFVEPLPLPENRITLLEERDKLGMRRARLVYEPSPLETRAIGETLKQFATVIGAAGRGRVHIDAAAIHGSPSRWGYHHFSSTRMHADPRYGVVDANCRVHGIQNLFVAGSSVFPTAGLMTPTLTIVALALRLAETVKGAVNA